jgi:hypothetical protein
MDTLNKCLEDLSMGEYFLNRETQKIELHFTKDEYIALSDNQKAEIKRHFLWSKYSSAWVSRSVNNHFYAEQIAQKLGLENKGKQGERLSYAEQIDRKVEKAEHRAERMETHACNAENRAVVLQKPLNDMHGDIAFFTQPNINSSAGRAFTNYRNKLYERYDRGFEEYRKSSYFKDRAETARRTASMDQFKDVVYLHNRIKECNSNIKKLKSSVSYYEELITKLESSITVNKWNGAPWTMQELNGHMNDVLERLEAEIDKLAFMENCLADIGGIKFSKNNIKVGYIVIMKRWGKCEILSTGPVNVTYKILTGGASGLTGVEPYAAINEIQQINEAEKIENPFNVGDILGKYSIAGNDLIEAYQVIKVTNTGVKLQEIAVKNSIPIADNFISKKVVQRKVVKSKYSNFIGVYMGDWQLSKYKPEKIAV